MNKQGWHDHDRQYNASADAGNAVLRNGRLRLTVRQETPALAADWGGQRSTSALGGAIDDRILPVAMEIDEVRVYQNMP